jgi:hypothetical protein
MAYKLLKILTLLEFVQILTNPSAAGFSGFRTEFRHLSPDLSTVFVDKCAVDQRAGPEDAVSLRHLSAQDSGWGLWYVQMWL